MPLPRRNTHASIALQTLIAENLGADMQLGRYLRRLAQATVLGLALSACGQSHVAGDDAGTDAMMDPPPDSPPPPPPDTPPPSDCGRPAPAVVPALELGPPLLCEPHEMFSGDFWNPLPLFAEQGFDYAAMIGQGGLMEAGVACNDASDTLACQNALDALFDVHADTHGLFFTRADEVGFVNDPAEIFEMFGGAITTGDQALFMVYLDGDHLVTCEGYASGVEETEGGFRVTIYRQELVAPVTEGRIQSEYFVDSATGEVDFVEERITDAFVVCGVGRRPPGLAAAVPRAATTPVGDLFAEIARLEESAVAAFDVMIEELTRLGAPQVLLDAAHAARADEVRHTASMGALARAYGVEPSRPEIETLAVERTPFEIALENAVEGCVRETYGALVGAHQALHATDPRIAAEMEVVAADEIRHAELSWALAGWLEPQLSDDERERIAAAKREAIAELQVAAAAPADESVVRLAGIPPTQTCVTMVASLARDIWA